MDNSKYEPVIGLEIHVELKTKSKMFCGCDANHFGVKPNTHCCPVCLGLPGALPVPNKRAIEWCVLLGKALNCKISSSSKFDRKNYFYPDLAKGYQISQYDEPIAIQGSLKLKIKNLKFKIEEKVFRIHRVHMEEDTGKLIHKEGDTLVDFNRSGVPLVEIVTEPDFRSSEEVVTFLKELHTIIRYLDISDADMEKGTMRMEPNISVREIRNLKFEIRNKSKITNYKLPNYKVEVKNINSFNYVRRAIEYEIKRHIEMLDKGETPVQETRGWDSTKNITYSQRAKEEAHDYRYFPEPDIPPFEFSDEYIDLIVKTIPELPQQKMERFIRDYKLKDSDAYTLTRNIKDCVYYEKIISKIKDQKSNIKFKSQSLEQDIANIIVNKKVSNLLSIEEFSKKVIELLTPHETDNILLETIIESVFKNNPKSVSDYKSGKQNAIMFLVGQVMKEMKGKVDAKIVIEKLKKRLTNI